MTEPAKDVNTPQEHSSLVGGSTAARRIGCPASYKLSLKVPPQPSSAAAREGTAFHELLARILIEDAEPHVFLPFTHKQPPKGVDPAWELTITEEMWQELGEPALMAFDTFAAEMEAEHGGEFQYIVEQSYEYPGIEGAKGTSDVIWRCGKVAGIIDWKMGYHTVEAEHNAQLLFYLNAARAGAPELFRGVETYAVAIIQPKADRRAAVWYPTHEDLAAFDAELRGAVEEALGDAPHAEEGPWCRYAPCNVVCPLKIGNAAKLGAAINRLSSGQMAPAPYEHFLSEALETLSAIEDWVSEVRNQAHVHLERGGKLPGWRLADKRSAGQMWLEDAKTLRPKLVRRYGVKANDIAPRVLLSPTQVAKLLAARGMELDQKYYAPKPSSGTRIVREDSDAPEHVEPMKRLGDLLNKAKEELK